MSLKNRHEWNWQPTLPIKLSPILDWPPNFLLFFKWLASYWLHISSIIIEVLLAIFIFYLFHPSAEEMKNFSFSWISQLWIRNCILITLVAGSLHFWFYYLKGQSKKLKFEKKFIDEKVKKFTFNNQLFDNIFWTIISGVTIWTIFESFYFWAASNDIVPIMFWYDNPFWYGIFFILIPIWSSAHFYIIHRLLHFTFLYKTVHNLHHRNISPGPWSGISMHPIEHILYFSTVVIHFVVPSSPIHVLFHFYQQGLNPAFSHSGFDSIVIKDKKRFKAGDFFHQLHHRYFNCNYGTIEMPWDRFFGTFNDGTKK